MCSEAFKNPTDSEAFKNRTDSEAFTPHNKQDLLKDNSDTRQGADWEFQNELSEVEDEGVKGAALKMLRKQAEMGSGRVGGVFETEHRIKLQPGAHPSHQIPYTHETAIRKETTRMCGKSCKRE